VRQIPLRWITSGCAVIPAEYKNALIERTAYYTILLKRRSRGVTRLRR
jgi:hypothetical protein